MELNLVFNPQNLRAKILSFKRISLTFGINRLQGFMSYIATKGIREKYEVYFRNKKETNKKDA